MTARVSVLMTIYNPGHYLRLALDSLLAQTFRDFELIAVENGSSDGAKAVIAGYAQSDPRVRLIDLPHNIGRTAALNLALREAKGEYVAVLDADDVTAPERLAEQVALLDARPQIVLVASYVRFIDANGNVVGMFCPPTEPAELRNSLAYANPFPHSASMFRCSIAQALGGYPSRYQYAQDFALWIALASRGELAMIAKPLADIRQLSTRLTQSPAWARTIHHESVELHRSAAELPGMSAEARRRGHIAIAVLHYAFARTLWTGRQPGAALNQFAMSFAAAPIYSLKWISRRCLGLETIR